MRFDLHCHSNASDGVLDPAQLVRRAAAAGLDGLALTDHDTVSGIPEALNAAASTDIELIPGLELSIQVGEKDIHVLGYWIDHEDPSLIEALAELGDMRKRRAERIVAKLVAMGLDIHYDDVIEQAGDGNPGRPHVAKALMARGHIHSVEEAFERFIGDDGPAYVPKSLMDIERGFKLLARHRAVPVFAHPALCDFEALLPEFISRGLAGLEVHHPKHTELQRKRLTAICAELDLVATGGSDFHMPGAASRAIGAEGVAGDVLAALRARRPS